MKHNDNIPPQNDEKLVKELMSEMAVTPTEAMRETSLKNSLSEFHKMTERRQKYKLWLRRLSMAVVGAAILFLLVHIPGFFGNGSFSSSSSSTMNGASSSSSSSSASRSSGPMKSSQYSSKSSAMPNNQTQNAHQSQSKATNKTSRPIQINQLVIGDSYQKALAHFGEPTKVVKKDNKRDLFYSKNSHPGVIVTVDHQQLMTQLIANPEFLDAKKLPNLPFTKDDVYKMYGQPTSTMNTQQGTPTLIYINNTMTLTISLNKDNTVKEMQLVKK